MITSSDIRYYTNKDKEYQDRISIRIISNVLKEKGISRKKSK